MLADVVVRFDSMVFGFDRKQIFLRNAKGKKVTYFFKL